MYIYELEVIVKLVSILVLVDVPLEYGGDSVFGVQYEVSILVLVDVPLESHMIFSDSFSAGVSILVLVDVPLEFLNRGSQPGRNEFQSLF